MRRFLTSLVMCGWLSGTAHGNEPAPLFLAVRLNGIEAGAIYRFVEQDGGLFIRAEDLGRLGIRAGSAAAIRFDSEDYLALDELPGLNYAVDWQATTVDIDCAAECFRLTVLSGRQRQAVAPTSGSSGWVVNYDLLAEVIEGEARLAGLGEVNLYTPDGTGFTSFLARDGERREVVRLESGWTVDQPDARRSLRVGDAVTRPARWQLPFRFGGAQLASDLSLEPGFLGFALPEVAGATGLPSTVEVYVDGARRLQERLPGGPFRITEVPVFTGHGEAEVVVTDLLGREQVITVPYYVSPKLLTPGLSTFALAAGALRDDYGIQSNHYDEAFASSAYRLGITPSLTGEVGAEASEDRQTAGMNATWLQPSLGVFDLSFAGSSSGRGTGGLIQYGYEWAARGLSLSFEQRLASPDFTQLGLNLDRRPPRQVTRVAVGTQVGSWGSVAANYAISTERDRSDREIVGASYSMPIRGFATLSLSGFHALRPQSDTTIGLRLTVPLGSRTTGSSSVSLSDGELGASAEVQRHPPFAGGFGYRAQVARGPVERTEADLLYNSRFAELQAGVARLGETEAARVGVKGAAVMTDQGAFLSRPIQDSFAIVDTGGHADVEVLHDHRPVGRTDSSGRLLVPGLRAYETNRLEIRPEDLPLDSAFARQTIEVVPARRSGVAVDFGVTPARAALLTVLGEDGAPLPAGSSLWIEGQADGRFPVARQGRAYVTGLRSGSRIQARSGERSCTFVIDREPPAGPLPAMGPFRCTSASP